jgi:phage repressor protein C with HTH and peptisase S24 domain
MSQPNLSAMENGVRGVPERTIALLRAKYGDIIDKYIITDISDDSDLDKVAVEAQNVGKFMYKQRTYKTYLLPMSAIGGTLDGISAPGVATSDCEVIVSPIKDVDFAITVYGDSMSPKYPSGSRLLVKRYNPALFIETGRVYVLDTENGVIVKEVHKSDKEGYIICHSINRDPKYTDFEIPLTTVRNMYRVLLSMTAE